ncbi:hypothetical protein EZV73_26500 [Acidaminobacter sp. JC074]|uniref:hypothetical protein n=1 Tax=Acidaminobacter sp. JC074 TaxID=2530199 RepID=UPI001F0DDA63|nr:hypothetical protein [Acidaminobacter sp. JC074]MCH4891157.1 hypothetical protein [Acidaminobacter sp. JC074]
MIQRTMIFKKKDNPDAYKKVREIINNNSYGKPFFYEYEILSDTSNMTLELLQVDLGIRKDYNLYSHSKGDKNHQRSNYFTDEMFCDYETYLNLSRDKKINYTVYTNVHYKSDNHFDEYAFYVFDDSHMIIELDRSADRHLFKHIYGDHFKKADTETIQHIQDQWRKKFD